MLLGRNTIPAAPVASSANTFDMDAAITPTIGPANIGNLFILDITALSAIDFGVTKFESEPRGSIMRELCRLDRPSVLKKIKLLLNCEIFRLFKGNLGILKEETLPTSSSATAKNIILVGSC